MADVPEPRYVVAGARTWNRRTFDERLAGMPGSWSLVTRPPELAQALDGEPPRYVFFLHWSWKVPQEITSRHECVVFHMTDVPYGRGGTPLQNLVRRGHATSVLSAIRMTNEIDAGPVYLKAPLSLEGTAEAVYLRADAIAASMIEQIVRDEPRPVAQEGEVVVFERLGPADSRLPVDGSLDDLHDLIRMLDADGYPAAFFDHGAFRLELRRSARYDGSLVADVRITRRAEGAS